ncbi:MULTISPECIES: hypothetical protein [unclassified Coleofasciculus]|uniref:hypothetical protein n=1 Tax=unclassified Coleofasciculus TaxID=2692782 RepID=UPI00188100B7|nr:MULTISPECIES: hypothetical protein [unclassified Coleofasciculus]MBE9127057.1 hypothetical protein [Coleofasciculus sp. LEGE 07081]MBE9150445.1 hypothetical protein [Coleofasciculus sp. LEGE 07092]
MQLQKGLDKNKSIESEFNHVKIDFNQKVVQELLKQLFIIKEIVVLLETYSHELTSIQQLDYLEMIHESVQEMTQALNETLEDFHHEIDR